MLAVGAFLLWGPIGLGNGPLNAGAGGVTGGTDPGGGPLGFIIPIRNSGDAPAVVDGVELIGGTRYADPHLLALGALTSGICGGRGRLAKEHGVSCCLAVAARIE